MIPYLLTSLLLSFISWTFYVAFLREKASPIQQKGFIYFSIITSLILPAILAQNIFLTHEIHKADFSWEIFQAADEEILMKHCACENPNYAHRFLYKADSFYHFLLNNSIFIKWFIALGLLFVGIRSFLQIRFLYFLSKRHTYSKKVINGKKVYILTLDGDYPFAAFYLNKPFIIVPHSFKKLDQKSQQAVLAHEFSHIQQKNTWETIILRFVQCIWLLNPVFYYFRTELSLISEYLADQQGAKAMQSKKAYAHLLLTLKDSSQIHSLSHGFARKSLKTRIHRLCYEAHLKMKHFLMLCLCTFCLQSILLKPTFETTETFIEKWQTYEKVYTTYPDKEEVIYCTDCESECK